MVMHVRSQRAHRCTTLTYHQATRSDQLATIVELILAHIVATSSTARLAASTGLVVWGNTRFLKDSQLEQGQALFTPHDYC